LDEAGVLVTPDGHPVLGDGGVITLERGTIEIDSQGAVIVDREEVDRLQVVDFPNAGDLTKVGSGRFATVDGAVPEAPPETWVVHQGYLESANVNPVQAMTEMIETSRAFEAYQKVIQSADEATSSSINDVGTTI
jgi:flagellar basal-body rod protein FlgG